MGPRFFKHFSRYSPQEHFVHTKIHYVTILAKNRLFTVGGHVTTANLNQSAMKKCHPEIKRAG